MAIMFDNLPPLTGDPRVDAILAAEKAKRDAALRAFAQTRQATAQADLASQPPGMFEQSVLGATVPEAAEAQKYNTLSELANIHAIAEQSRQRTLDLEAKAKAKVKPKKTAEEKRREAEAAKTAKFREHTAAKRGVMDQLSEKYPDLEAHVQAEIEAAKQPQGYTAPGFGANYDQVVASDNARNAAREAAILAAAQRARAAFAPVETKSFHSTANYINNPGLSDEANTIKKMDARRMDKEFQNYLEAKKAFTEAVNRGETPVNNPVWRDDTSQGEAYRAEWNDKPTDAKGNVVGPSKLETARKKAATEWKQALAAKNKATREIYEAKRAGLDLQTYRQRDVDERIKNAHAQALEAASARVMAGEGTPVDAILLSGNAESGRWAGDNPLLQAQAQAAAGAAAGGTNPVEAVAAIPAPMRRESQQGNPYGNLPDAATQAMAERAATGQPLTSGENPVMPSKPGVVSEVMRNDAVLGRVLSAINPVSRNTLNTAVFSGDTYAVDMVLGPYIRSGAVSASDAESIKASMKKPEDMTRVALPPPKVAGLTPRQLADYHKEQVELRLAQEKLRRSDGFLARLLDNAASAVGI